MRAFSPHDRALPPGARFFWSARALGAEVGLKRRCYLLCRDSPGVRKVQTDLGP